MTTYFLTKTVTIPFDQALARTREALTAEGFGIPTEMDTQAIFKAKLGKDSERRVILGACLPQVAFEALALEPQIAVLLPCNVTVREVAGGSEITTVRPTALLSLASQVPPSHAEEVEKLLVAVLKRLD